MTIFNLRPQDPDALMKYYGEIIRDIKQANAAYRRQNEFLVSRLVELEDSAFFENNREVLDLQKENRKLKKSLHKLYEKYIKPTQILKTYCRSSPNEGSYISNDPTLIGMSYRTSDGSWHTIKAK